MKQLFCLSLLIGFCALIGKGWHVAKDGFQIRRTVCQLPKKMAAAPDMSTINALDQTYTYLGRGHQCYAFASEDGRFVIKLPRQDRYRLSFFLRACPISCLTKEREAVRSDLLARQDFLSQSFEIAFEDLREETALLYLHLNETDCFSRPLLIKDRLGRSYTLDPNRTAFLLQEKNQS